MARDRQRAKQRQAERRAQRLAAEAEGREAEPTPEDDAAPEGAAPDTAPREADPAPREPETEPREADPGAGSADLAAVPPGPDGEPEPHLAVGATSEHLGSPDAIIEDEPALDDDEELEGYDFEDEEQPVDGGEAYAPRGRRGDTAPDKSRPRVIQFLFNCWAELQRVEWPKRQQLITLTWVVIGFVIIAGTYLGLLDFVFNSLVQAIL